MERKIKKGISGSTLKLIAMFTMLLDHIGAVLLEPFMVRSLHMGISVAGTGVDAVNGILRLFFGRMAFPIFCFLLVEGFGRTRNIGKYALRLLLFGLISEVPFDLARTAAWPDWGYQNVMFTLLTGLLVMYLSDRALSACKNRFLSVCLCGGILVAGMAAADFLRTDYGGYGVLCIAVLYYFRKNRIVQLIAGAAAFWLGEFFLLGGTSELFAPLGFLAAFFYDGRRGLRLKYLFYAFYPFHLAVLYAIRMFLGF